jgi:hypothetical protein
LLKTCSGLSDDDENTFVYINGRKLCCVVVTNEPLLPRELATFEYPPYCLSVGHGFISVGGDLGMVTILQILPHSK